MAEPALRNESPSEAGQSTGPDRPGPVVRLSGITKRYGGALALTSVDFDVFPGEIHALLGENGAGKSTLAKIVSGATMADEGTMEFDGRERRFNVPGEATAAGVAMVYQETSLVDSMTVAQNLFLGNEKIFNRLSPLNIAARELLESHNFHIRPEVTVGSLGAAQKSMVEIARAVHRNAKLVILDEPTASVTPEEKQQLFLSMQNLKRRGVGIIFISHNIEEALSEADRITVLRDGEVQATLPTTELSRDKIVRLMVGRDVEYTRRPAVREPGRVPVLEVDDLTVGNIVRNMSFSVFPGEIVGIAGLVGAGRTETAMVVCGAMKRRRLHGGEVRLEGRPVRYRTPRRAFKDGIAYITEDRKAAGFFSHLTISDNVYLGHLSSARRLPPLSTPGKRKRLVAKLVDRFRIRALDPARAKLVELSGGNQQKVVLAKGLTRMPKVAILDEPTRGVDVGAIEEIHALIRELAEAGVAVVVISSYLPEILAVSDRILVARAGRIVAEFETAEASEEKIMFAAVH
jgi:ABC-type sugar transport system ATPase subunit